MVLVNLKEAHIFVDGQFKGELARKNAQVDNQGVKIHVLTQHLEVTTEEAVHYYPYLEEFKANAGVSWAHDFESTKRRVKKVYSDLALPPSYLLDYTSAIVEYNAYNDSSDIERGEASSRVIVQTSIDARNEIEVQSTTRIYRLMEEVSTTIVLSKNASRVDHYRT